MDELKQIVTWIRVRARLFSEEEHGAGEIIAVVVVLAIVIMLGVAFSDRISTFFQGLWTQATEPSSTIGDPIT